MAFECLNASGFVTASSEGACGLRATAVLCSINVFFWGVLAFFFFPHEPM